MRELGRSLWRRSNESTRITELDEALGLAMNIARVAHALTFAGVHADGSRWLAFADAQLEDLGSKPPWVARMNETTRERVVSADAVNDWSASFRLQLVELWSVKAFRSDRRQGLVARW